MQRMTRVRRWRTQLLLLCASLPAIILLGQAAASAAAPWHAQGSGNSGSQAKPMLPPTFNAATINATSVTLNWSAPSSGAPVTGYTLAQSPGTLAGCSATPTAGTTSCTATGLTTGTQYTWTLKAKSSNWTSSAATDTETPVVAFAITSVTRNGGNAKYVFTGTGGSSGIGVTVSVCTTSDFATCTPLTSATAIAAADGTWTTGTTNPNIPAGTTYYARAVQTGPSGTSAVFPFTAS